MELNFNKNNQLKVRLAIVESQLKCAKDQIKILKNKNSEFKTKHQTVLGWFLANNQSN